MKLKGILISFITGLALMGGIVFLRFHAISKDFTVWTGVKAMTSLLTGQEVVEFRGNDNQPLIMIKSENETDFATSYESVITYLEATKSYFCHPADAGALSCEEDPLLDVIGKENLWIDAEKYTSYFVVFKLPKEKEVTR